MSDASEGLGDLASALEGANLFEETPPAETDPGQAVTGDTGPSLSAFAQSYLEKVDDEAARQILTQHIPEWDKGFQSFAQRVAQERSRYDQLGTFEELQAAHQLREMIRNDPHAVASWLVSQGYGTPQQTQTPPAGQTDPLEGLDPNLRAKLTEFDTMKTEVERTKAALGAMYERFQNDQQQREVAEHERIITEGLTAAKAKYPNLNEIAVLNLMKGGMELDAAVDMIAGMVQQGVNQSRAPRAPQVVSATSLPPTQRKVSEMSEDERVAGLAAMLGGVLKD